LEEEYDDEKSAERDKQLVEFNRSILVNGFRRLEALERKREFEVMNKSSSSGGKEEKNNDRVLADPLEPSILLSTLCANSSNSSSQSHHPRGSSRTRSNATSGTKTITTTSSSGGGMSEALWEESGIGLTCAKLCPPDGRRVAVGCDDSAIRIWDLMEKGDAGGEACQVLLGHKNGFPVFDLSWNKDGRSLLSAGGDGSVRLWDTMAQGPFGQVTKPNTSSSTINGKKTLSTERTATVKKATNAVAREALENATKNLDQVKVQPDMTVPGLRPESAPYRSGAALAVYRGHAPNTPIWSVAFAPCGYYFASAGADATARLWTTDRSVPVRLFTGHTSNSVHSVVFHPNCNYILTGCEDRTARLWDIQTGCCVRLLNGCPAGIHKIEIDPSGQYAAGADAKGTVHLWDLGTGKKVTEFRPKTTEGGGMVHSLSFSACGTALASGGDDRCVRIWDVQKAATVENKPVVDVPFKSFPTRRTMLMDLHYTKRNLLLTVGKYITAVPIVTPIAD
jgi:WD40 repeat protein